MDSSDLLSGLNLTSSIPAIEIPDIRIPDPDEYKRADYQYELIKETIQDFENALDDNHEVALKLASFGQTILMSVTEIGYANPYLMFFHGFVDDKPATLIQHMNQLNFLLWAVPKSQPDAPARRIGFADSSETD